MLGAIISPPDAIAATAIAERLKVPAASSRFSKGKVLSTTRPRWSRIVSRVAAVATGSFSLAHASGQFSIVGSGGILTGLAVGWLAQQFHKRVDDAPIEITVSLLTPFVAYLVSRADRRFWRARGRDGRFISGPTDAGIADL